MIFLEKNDYYRDHTFASMGSFPYYSEIDSFKCFIDYATFRQYGKGTTDSLKKEIASISHKKIFKKNHRWDYKVIISEEKVTSFIKSDEEDVDYNITQLYYISRTNEEIKGYPDC